MMLLPHRWNRHVQYVQYAWRYDPCELAAPGSAAPAPREPRVDVWEEEEDFLDWPAHIVIEMCEDEHCEPMDES